MEITGHGRGPRLRSQSSIVDKRFDKAQRRRACLHLWSAGAALQLTFLVSPHVPALVLVTNGARTRTGIYLSPLFYTGCTTSRRVQASEQSPQVAIVW